MPKYVVSSTLTDPEWANTTVIGGDPVAAVRRLKEAPGKDIVQYGFGQLSHAMLEHGLLDELRLWVHPLIVGSAEPGELLHRNGAGALFELVDTTSLQNGVVILAYRAR
jgi:dihydrofolate reductase